MNHRLPIILALCFVASTLHAQYVPGHYPYIHIGDPAPPLQLKEWIKGQPFQTFEKGHVYVLEFWATWCAPCRAAIPHLSDLARKYRNKATFLGIGILETGGGSLKKIKTFVDSMGSRMDYAVAREDSNFMEKGWLNAVGQTGIPHTIVVDAEGRIAWIGHPAYLAKVLPEIINNRWDIAAARAKKIEDRYLDSLDSDAYYKILPYIAARRKADGQYKPDALFVINSIVTAEPTLQYAPRIAYQTFAALLRTDQQKACEYGRKVIVTSTYTRPAIETITDVIEWTPDSVKLSPEVYLLGAEAWQTFIDNFTYAEDMYLQDQYAQMAEWYARAGKKSKAVRAQQKAIEILKSKKDFSADDLAGYESRLRQYKTGHPLK